MHALADPATWIPAAGAGAIAAGGWDRSISDWAVENTPVFGSEERALRASDELRAATNLTMLGTAMFVPDAESPVASRVERALVEEGGAVVTTSTTTLLKQATGRLRPDGSDFESFPSGHASRAAACASMAVGNLDEIPMSPVARSWLKAGSYTLAAGTAWARVEGGVHFPTDVLAGMALGNYLGRLTHDAFFETQPTYAFGVGVERHGAVLTFRYSR